MKQPVEQKATKYWVYHNLCKYGRLYEEESIPIHKN